MNYFRKDNILFAICIYVTLIGSLIIIIKKFISRQIIQRIPKSNIQPQPGEDSFEMATLHAHPRTIQVRPINTGDSFLLIQKFATCHQIDRVLQIFSVFTVIRINLL